MAELLVIKEQRMNRSMFPGDVVIVQPDGWRWGRAERGPDADSLWCVIEVPGVSTDAFTEFLQPLTVNGRQMLFRRVHLNLMAIGERPTYEQVMAARMEKIVNPLLS
jgi:hypothetical protein